NSQGQDAIVLDGNTGFVARDHAGKLVFNFAGEANITGNPSGLWLGTGQEEGGGHPGLLILRDAAGADSIVVNGAIGDIVLAKADVAEDFEVAKSADEIEPGSVVVVDEDGSLDLSRKPYDKRV